MLRYVEGDFRQTCPGRTFRLAQAFEPSAGRFAGRVSGNCSRIQAEDTQQHLSMLTILQAAASTALDHFRAADNPVDTELVADLETMVERTRLEIERLTALFAKPS